jgi:hypothetical protein
MPAALTTSLLVVPLARPADRLLRIHASHPLAEGSLRDWRWSWKATLPVMARAADSRITYGIRESLNSRPRWKGPPNRPIYSSRGAATRLPEEPAAALQARPPSASMNSTPAFSSAWRMA